MVNDGSPTVTVITATYNCSATLKLTLASLLNQSFTDFEAWVIGDGCTDDSENIVRGFQDTRLHWKNLPHNHGSQAFPNNEGLRLARGRYIAYLGHDDLWLAGHLAGLVRHIEATQADFVHSLCVCYDPTGVRLCFGGPRPETTYARHFVPPTCWLHKRSVTHIIGEWRDPAQLPWGVDHDVMMRVYRAGLHMSGAQQASVLKFPSAWFGTYALKGTPPQAHWWQQIKTDPNQVEHALLQTVTHLCAQSQQITDMSMLRLVTEPFRILKRQLLYKYGHHGPLHLPFRWYFQYRRRGIKKRRGLATK